MHVAHTDQTGTDDAPASTKTPQKKAKKRAKAKAAVAPERVPFPRMVTTTDDLRKERVALEAGAYEGEDGDFGKSKGRAQAPLAELIAMTLAGEHAVASHFLENALDQLADELDCLHYALSGDFAIDREDAGSIAYRLSVRARAIAEIHERLRIVEATRAEREAGAA